MTMLATASKPRGVRSSVREMKLPAALLMRSVRGPLVQIASIISSTARALRISTPWLTTRPPCRSINSVAVSSQTLLRRPQIWTSAPSSKKALGHGFAEPGAASGDEDAPAGEELFAEHVWFPPKGIVC